MNLANKITLTRVFLVPFVFTLLILGTNMDIAQFEFLSFNTNWLFLSGTILFIIAAFTDFLDGYIARKTNTVTTFGKFLDPIADKALVNGTLIILAWNNLTFVWLVIIFIVRDIIVDAGRMMAAKENIVVAASIWGKAKTMAQMIAMPIIMLFTNLTNTDLHSTLYVCLNIPLFIAAVLTLIGMCDYLHKLKPIIVKSI